MTTWSRKQVTSSMTYLDPTQSALSRRPNTPSIRRVRRWEPRRFRQRSRDDHPDKGTEIFLYELSVEEDHRQRGIGTALVTALQELAQENGCYAMWVLTDDDNEPALKTYRKSGSTETSANVMLTWRLRKPT